LRRLNRKHQIPPSTSYVSFKTATEEEFRQQGIKIIEISEEDINQIYGIMTIESIDKKLEPNTIIKIVSRKNKKS
jgi:hypothetical protein